MMNRITNRLGLNRALLVSALLGATVLVAATGVMGASVALADRLGQDMYVKGGWGSPTKYFFRGMLINSEGLMVQADSSLNANLYDSELITLTAPVDIWMSFHPGNESEVPNVPQAWYEARLGTGMDLRIDRLTLGGRMLAYMSPNGSFGTVYEMNGYWTYDDTRLWGERDAIFKGLHPRGEMAIEAGGARDGFEPGIFMGGSVAPRLRLLSGVVVQVDLVMPMAFGMSLGNYYQVITGFDPALEPGGSEIPHEEDTILGFVSGGAQLEILAGFVPKRWGRWTQVLGGQSILPMAQTRAVNSPVKDLEIVFTTATRMYF